MNKYIDGLKFGMILQFAVGPICMMVFNTAQSLGFGMAMWIVLATVIADLLYITLACFGVSKLLNKSKVKRIVKYVGASILIVFGINIIIGVWGMSVIPGVSINATSTNIFIQGLIFALSNPLAIIFWGGVLSSKVIEEGFSKKQLFIFALGLISATFIFLFSIAVLGTIISGFIPEIASKVLNVIVGIIIILFGIKMIIKKEEEK